MIVKKIIIVDGNGNDESVVRNSLGNDYDVTSYSLFDFNSMALSTVITIANMLDAADPYSGGRALRIAVCARDIAKNLGLDEGECQNVYFVALLHDLGMITISESIRNKPGRLDANEYARVREHTLKGVEMLRDIDVVANLSDGVLYHHERWDGTGYPKGLAGNDIPQIARIIAVADAYDAMSSDRVYRSRLSPDKIISEFTRCRGSQFDPDIADVFIFMLKEGYLVDRGIEQTKEASIRAASEGGLRSVFAADDTRIAESEDGMDVITGLFTRSYLNTRVGKKITEERTGALMLIDLTGYDRSTEGNDQEAFDVLIRKLSDRLRSFFREADIVCRISKDRFAVYVSGESGKNVVEKKASMITDMIGTYSEFEQYRDTALGLSTGIAMCQEDGVTFEELYGSALAALERAKA